MKKVNILMLEDSLLDEELIKLELDKMDFTYESIRVDNESDFTNELHNFIPDLILSDFSLPQFNGIEALGIAKKLKPNIPFIIVTGSLSEEVAADCIKSGAWDYVVKERLFRLNSAIINVLSIKEQMDNARSALDHKKKYEFIVNASPYPLSLINRDYKFEAINQAYCNFYGIEHCNLINQPLIKVWGEKFENTIKKYLDRCFMGETFNIKDWITSPSSNNTKFMEVSFTPYYNENSEITHVVVANHDITELKLAQDRIKESEKKFRFLADNSIDVLWQLDRKFNFIYASPSVYEILGYKSDEVININYRSLCSESEYYRFLSYTQRSFSDIKKTNLTTLETVLYHKNGGKIPIEINSKVLLNDDDEIIGLQGAFRDIRTRKSHETQIQKLNTAVVQSPTSIMITDLEGNIEYVNPEFTNITGYSFAEVLGKNPRILKSNKTSEKEYNELWKAITRGKTWEGEFQNVKKDGTLYWESARISPIRNREGEITNYLGVKQNITPRKLAEFALKESELKLRTVLDYSPIAILQYDFSAVHKYISKLRKEKISGEDLAKKPKYILNALKLLKLEGINRATIDLFEINTIQDLINHRYQTFTKDALYKIAFGLAEIATKKITSYEFTTTLKSFKDTKKICLIRLAATPNHEQDYKLVIATILDITKREEARRELAESLKEKDIMLKEIHHRVKNNLQIISSILNMQRRNIANEETIRLLSDSISRVKSMSLIHDNMYHSESLEAIDTNIYVKKLYSFLISSMNYSHKNIELSTNIQHINIDLDRSVSLGLIINEVLSNCLKHAFDDNQGKIDITFEENNNKYLLTIKDNGKGFSNSVDLDNPKSLGLQLIKALSLQLKATSRFSYNNGTSYTLEFDVKR